LGLRGPQIVRKNPRTGLLHDLDEEARESRKGVGALPPK
jgi:hypothetical protein